MGESSYLWLGDPGSAVVGGSWFQAWVSSVLDEFGVRDRGVLAELPGSVGMVPVVAAVEWHVRVTGADAGFVDRSGGYDGLSRFVSDFQPGTPRSADIACPCWSG